MKLFSLYEALEVKARKWKIVDCWRSVGRGEDCERGIPSVARLR
jgi:hypothetical protein